MNILYGVNGLGYGHSSRALVIAKYLEDIGHNVKIVANDDAYRVLKDKFDCIESHGLKTVFKKNSVKNFATVVKNIQYFPRNVSSKIKFKDEFQKFNPDLCITDQEPIVAEFARQSKIPVISIDNSHALINLENKLPMKHQKDFIIAKQILQITTGRVNHYIITDFTDSIPIKKNVTKIPPIVRTEVQKLKPKYNGPVLVYLSKGDENSLEPLKNFENEKFVVYGFDKNYKVGNIEFKTREHFLRDLEDCKCIIGTAGFSLISEAIYLNKPYLAVPLKGQIEQIFNAIQIEKAGFGAMSKKITEKDVGYFFYRLEKFKKKLRPYNPDQKIVINTIEKIIEDVTKKTPSRSSVYRRHLRALNSLIRKKDRVQVKSLKN